MFQTGFLTVCIISLSFASLPAPMARADTDRFTLTDLGTLGGQRTHPYGINAQGWVVGDSQRSDGTWHAFLWHDGTMTDLFAGCDSCGNSHASAINNAGQVVGFTHQLPGGTDGNRGFVWQNGQFTDLGRMPGYEDLDHYPYPYAINDNGDVAGSLGNGSVPFIYNSRAGGWTQIGTNGGIAYSINNAGQVAGYFDLGPLQGGIQPFRYSAGTVEMLPILPGGYSQGSGQSIGPNGDVVGWLMFYNGLDNPQHAVRWHKAGGTWSASNLFAGNPLDTNSLAAWVLDPEGGEIFGCHVVYGGRGCGMGVTDVFLAGVPDSGPPVTTLVAETIDGCDVVEFTAANSKGQFVGAALCGDGQVHALVWTPKPVDTPNHARASWCPPREFLIGAKDTMTGMMGIGAAIALFPGGQAAGGATLGASGVGYIIYSYQKIYCYYGDPFDPNFAAVFSPQFHDQPAISTDDCLTAALADEMTQTLNHFRRANSYLQAVQMTLNREQSAYTFGDDASANLQDAALPGYTDGIVSELTAFKNGIRDIATQLTGSLCDITISQDDVVAFINAVQAGGIDALPQVVRDLLTLFGVDPTVVVAAIINTDPTQVPLNFAAALNAVADVAGQIAGGYQP